MIRERKEKEGNRNAFYILILEAKHCHFGHILSVGSESLGPSHIQGEKNSTPPLEGRSIKEFVDIF